MLTGILVRFEEGKLVMAATDSYRLSVKETALEQGPAKELEAIVPARALGELARVAAGGRGRHAGRSGILDNQVVFDVDGVTLTARRIDGQFPNYKQLVPEAFEAEVRCRARSSWTSFGARRSWRSASRRFAFASPRAR